MQWDKIYIINLDMFLELIELCVNNNYFYFSGKYLRQYMGTAMGNPLSPILADIVMDSLLLAISINLIQTTLDTFNSYH